MIWRWGRRERANESATTSNRQTRKQEECKFVFDEIFAHENDEMIARSMETGLECVNCHFAQVILIDIGFEIGIWNHLESASLRKPPFDPRKFSIIISPSIRHRRALIYQVILLFNYKHQLQSLADFPARARSVCSPFSGEYFTSLKELVIRCFRTLSRGFSAPFGERWYTCLWCLARREKAISISVLLQSAAAIRTSANLIESSGNLSG